MYFYEERKKAVDLYIKYSKLWRTYLPAGTQIGTLGSTGK